MVTEKAIASRENKLEMWAVRAVRFRLVLLDARRAHEIEYVNKEFKRELSQKHIMEVVPLCCAAQMSGR